MTESHGPRHRWTDEEIAMLGKEPDSALAAKLGLHATTVRGKRARLGIPPAVPPGAVPIYTWSADMVARLGTITDAELASEWGMSTTTVAQERRTRGIKARGRVTAAPKPAKLIKRPQMTFEDLRAWHQSQGHTYDSGAASLGVSRRAYGTWLAGTAAIPGPVSYACAALASGLGPWARGAARVMTAVQFEALAQLAGLGSRSPEASEAARLVFVEGQRPAAAARALDLSPQAVNGALARCREALRLAHIVAAEGAE